MDFRFYPYWHNPSQPKKLIYNFWFSEKEFTMPFIDHFNKIYETQLHSITPGGELEMPDNKVLDTLGVDPNNLEQGWFIEILGPKLDDATFDDLAATFGGEYDGWIQAS